MGAQHTPPMSGPWDQDGDAPAPWSVESDDDRVVVKDACGGLVAECTDGFHGDDDRWHMAPKSDDIARLIAAAPDLLDALRWITDHAASFMAMGAHEPGGEFEQWGNGARAAIAKATGATQ